MAQLKAGGFPNRKKAAARAVRKLKPSTKAAMTTIAKRVFSRNVENKQIGWDVEKCVNHNMSITGADCEPLIQLIPQLNDMGPGYNSSLARVGDRITPKSLTVRGIVSKGADFNNTTNTPLYVRVVIAQMKTIRTGSQVLAGGVDTNRLLRPSNNTSPGSDQTPFVGNTLDLTYPINKDLFRVYYDKVHKLAASTGSGAEAAPLTAARWSYRFKSLPKSLTFDEGSGDWPNNFAPFVAIGAAYPDCTIPDSGVKFVSNVHSILAFEDA